MFEQIKSMINMTLITICYIVLSAHKTLLKPISQALVFIYLFQRWFKVFQWEYSDEAWLTFPAGWNDDYSPVGEEVTWTGLITLSEMLYHFMFAGSLFWKLFFFFFFWGEHDKKKEVFTPADQRMSEGCQQRED